MSLHVLKLTCYFSQFLSGAMRETYHNTTCLRFPYLSQASPLEAVKQTRSLITPCFRASGKIEHKLFFLKLFGHLRHILAKIPGYPAKKFVFPGFEGHTELFGPHPFMWKTPTVCTHPKISGPRSLGLGSFFLPDQYKVLRVVGAINGSCWCK